MYFYVTLGTTFNFLIHFSNNTKNVDNALFWYAENIFLLLAVYKVGLLHFMYSRKYKTNHRRT